MYVVHRTEHIEYLCTQYINIIVSEITPGIYLLYAK